MSLKQTLEDSFKTYAGMTIMDRAICDARDCLKPGARMSMYAQYIEKITADKPYRKAQKSVAAAMDHFYVHGDMSLYPLLARMGKPFAMRYVLEDFQGNTGTIECGDNEAASRYTEMRLSPLAMNLFTNIEKDTINKWYESYTGEEYYPAALPSVGYYNIVNGTSGIATAIASSIPQFNLKEVNEAMIKLLWNPDAPFDEIYCAPDFCTGALLLNGKEVKESLEKGTGFACKLRSVIEYSSSDRCLIVKEIPYSVYTEVIRNQLMEICENDDNPGIERFLDQSGIKPLIKIYLSKKANPEKVIRYLYKNTSLQYHYAINMIMLDRGTVPKVFGWREALQAHIDHEINVYTNAYNYDLKKLNARKHILEGYLICLAQIEEVVKVIKTSASTAAAKEALIKNFAIDDAQATAVLKLTLSKLAHLEVQKIENEKKDIESEIERITSILADKNLLNQEIEKGMRAVANKYGDDRRTKILNIESEDDEEPVEVHSLQCSLTNKNNIFITEATSLYTQKRGGVGAKLKMSDGEYVLSSRQIESNEEIIFFAQNGSFYHYAAHNITVGDKIPVESFLPIKAGEEIRAMTSLNKKDTKPYIVFITKNGLIKKSDLEEYNIKRNTGTKALTLDEGDEIVNVLFINNEKIGMLSAGGNFIMVDTTDIRPIGRVAKGIKGMKLNDDDYVINARAIPADTTFITSISGEGMFKRTDFSEFNTQGKNTKGSKIQKLNDGDWMADFMPMTNETDILIASTRACIKLSVNDIPKFSKGAIGNKSIKLNANDNIVGIS